MQEHITKELNAVEETVKAYGKIRMMELCAKTGINPGRLYYRLLTLELQHRVRLDRPYPGVVLVLPGGQA
jgi:hypothetical protein